MLFILSHLSIKSRVFPHVFISFILNSARVDIFSQKPPLASVSSFLRVILLYPLPFRFFRCLQFYWYSLANFQTCLIDNKKIGLLLTPLRVLSHKNDNHRKTGPQEVRKRHKTIVEAIARSPLQNQLWRLAQESLQENLHRVPANRRAPTGEDQLRGGDRSHLLRQPLERHRGRMDAGLRRGERAK